jgi:two-component system probable response regulator PhcQ
MSTAYDYKKYAILYVDDEEQALKYFRKSMKDFTVLVATNVAEANAILDKSADTIGVVITDQRMPGALGVELLKRLRTQWPHIIRLLITAYSEIDDAIEAVNSGAIYKYVTKPADLNELKKTLTAAMELFLNQRERDILLKERLSVIQRMIVADRVRSLAAMAGGISHHLRNSMTALTCFLEEAAALKSGEVTGGDPKFTDQLWALAHKEREHLLTIVNRVAQTTNEGNKAFANELSPAELVALAITAAVLGDRKVETKITAADGKLKLDAEGATTALRILLKYVARLSEASDPMTISAEVAQVGGAAGVRIRVIAGAKAYTEEDVAAFFTPFAFPANDPSDLGVELLRAFSVAYQHGGDVIVNREAPTGPGFDLLLPMDPNQVLRPELQEGLLEKLFTHFESTIPTPVASVADIKAA